MTFKVTKRRVARTFVLVVIVICLSRENLWDVVWKMVVVSLHGVWECMDAPIPGRVLNPKALYKLAKDAVFDLAEK